MLIFALLTLGAALSLYRHFVHDVPWLPGEIRQIWSIEAKVEFSALDNPVMVTFAIPDTQPGLDLIAEHTASPGYGLAYLGEGQKRRAEWSIRQASGKQVLYYRVDMLVNSKNHMSATVNPPEKQLSIQRDGPYATIAQQILSQAIQRSADAYTLTRQLIHEVNTQTQSAQFLAQKQDLSLWLVDLLQQADVPARPVQVLHLEDGRRRQQLETYIQVYQDGEFALFHPQRGMSSKKNLLLWEYNNSPLIDVVGGRNASVYYSIIELEVPVEQVGKRGGDRPLLDFSIHSLPIGEQALFKNILLIPVGVFVVVFMRLFIGIRTSGTFMPVLIAIAFMQTTLKTGLVGFALVVGVGLMIRSLLSQLNLLLVARISAVIITVIILIALFTVIAYRMGLNEALKITFFPMIILSWTIERMSILWEEEGSGEVFMQVGGSLAVAIVTYFFMQNDIVRHLTFNFLGLQFILMALVIIMGSYTGYRLLELHRFFSLTESDKKT